MVPLLRVDDPDTTLGVVPGDWLFRAAIRPRVMVVVRWLNRGG